MSVIELPCYGITIELGDEGNGSITSDLKDQDPYGVGEGDEEWIAYVDAIESIVLAHACAGIDVTETRYIEGIETAIEAGSNNL